MLPCFRRSLVFSLWYTEHKESWIRPDQTHPHSPEPRTPQPSAYHPCLLQGTRHDLRVCELSWQPLRSSLFIVGWTAPQSRSIVVTTLAVVMHNMHKRFFFDHPQTLSHAPLNRRLAIPALQPRAPLMIPKGVDT